MRSNRANKRKLFSLIGASNLLAGILMAAVPVSAYAETSDQYCIMTVAKVASGSPEAKVIDNSCGSTREAAAAKRPALQASVLLVKLYQHTNQNAGINGWVVDLVADAECDSAGWGFSDLRPHNDRVIGISSYSTFNQCNGSSIHSETDYNGFCGRYSFTWNVNVPWACNDHVYSMRLYKSY